jgi:adenosylmethionine-8-amino-7-oxononanoate aminotransferase
MHWEAEWDEADLQTATEENVMLTWGPSGPAKDLPKIVRGEGVYLYDDKGNRYLDWTSQAICVNLGHTVPREVTDAVEKQMQELPYIYGGMGMCPVRSRLSKLMAELTPGDITGFLFPCGGSEANEAAIRMARRYTGRQKILTQYRSYHGGAAASLGATGDFRRFFSEQNVTGFVKIFNPQPLGFTWGKTDEEANRLCLQALEEQILQEGPNSIAAIMLESIVGAGGVLVPPTGYMQGVRALCDKYDILLILDEVMTGFGRTGELWAFEHFEGVVPDIVTSAKGLTGAIMPMSLVGVREKIKQYFHKQPLGWGATYQAHPVAMACAYECVKYTVQQRLPQKAKALQSVMMEEINTIVEKHTSVKQGRAIGLFGCLDLQQPDGKAIQPLAGPSPPHVTAFRQALRENGLMALFRPPLLHCCPPLVISETELRDGFQRLSTALAQLDASQVKLM